MMPSSKRQFRDEVVFVGLEAHCTGFEGGLDPRSAADRWTFGEVPIQIHRFGRYDRHSRVREFVENLGIWQRHLDLDDAVANRSYLGDCIDQRRIGECRIGQSVDAECDVGSG